MNKINVLFLLAIITCLLSCGNNEIKIKVEKLSKPSQLLELKSFDETIKELILSENNVLERDSSVLKNFPFNIVAESNNISDIVDLGSNPFFNGMYRAYADHRPFTISPDMIWLLISQGFAHHVNNNAEELRKSFVKHDGKISLLVMNDQIRLDDPYSPWQEVFPKLNKQIGENVGKEIVDVLTCNFSTTTINEKIASEITILETFKSYFEYIVFSRLCGIPEITLKGTPRDWQLIYDKAQSLRKYKLDWWIDELNPVLLEFIRASKGNINKDFWRKMFKYHREDFYGAPAVIDGWIVKFYPYNKSGKRNNLQEIIKTSDALPNEMVKVDLKHIQQLPNFSTKETPLELWAGFVGLCQTDSNFNLTPQIGWFIRKKTKDISHEVIKGNKGFGLRVKVFPKELLQIDSLDELSLHFTDTIDIPAELKKVKMDVLEITGELAPEKIDSLIGILGDYRYVGLIAGKICVNKVKGKKIMIDTLYTNKDLWITTKYNSVKELLAKRINK